MRPNAPHNPPVEPVEERSDVGSLVVMAPPAQYRIEFLDQLLGLKRYASPGKRAHLIHEAADRFLPGDSVQFPRLSTTANLARWQPKLLAAPIARPRRKDDRLAEAGSVSGSGARPSGHRWHAASVINIQPPTPHINPHSISVETPADARKSLRSAAISGKLQLSRWPASGNIADGSSTSRTSNRSDS